MKKLLLIVSALLLIATTRAWSQSAFPVMASSNGVVVSPTNFWSANPQTNVPTWAAEYFTQPRIFNQVASNYTAGSAGSVTVYSSLSAAGFVLPIYPPTNAEYIRLLLRSSSALSAPAFTEWVNFAYQSRTNGLAPFWATNMLTTISSNWTEVVVPLPSSALVSTQCWFRFVCSNRVDTQYALSNYYKDKWEAPLNGPLGEDSGYFAPNSGWYPALMANPYSTALWYGQIANRAAGVYIGYGSYAVTGAALPSGGFSNAVTSAVLTALTNPLPALVVSPTIFGVAGREVNVYTDGLIHDAAALYVDIYAGIGNQLAERWTYTGPPATNYLTITTWDVNNPTNQRALAQPLVTVCDTNSGGGSNVVLLTIGDSITSPGLALDAVSVLDGADTNISVTTIGTHASASLLSTNAGVSGWSTASFAINQAEVLPRTVTNLLNLRLVGHSFANTCSNYAYCWVLTNTGATRTLWLYKDPARGASSIVGYATRSGDGAATIVATNGSGLSGTLDMWFTSNLTDAANRINVNAFCNNGSAFSLNHFLTNTGLPSPTHVIINLGVNDLIGQGMSDSNVLFAMISCTNNLSMIVSNIHAYSARIKVGVALTVTPAKSQDANGATTAYNPTWRRGKRNSLMVNSAIARMLTGHPSSNTFCLPLNTGVDSVYGMSWGAPTNASFWVTNQVTRQIDSIHPSSVGQLQAGEVYWGWLKQTKF